MSADVRSDMVISPKRRARLGFSLIEIMVVVATIALLVTIAIPQFQRYQMRAKSAEVRANLAAIRVVEDSYYSENGAYISAAPEPPTVPGLQKADFNASGSDFAVLGWAPESDVFFSYGVQTSADGAAFTADAGADIDGDGIVQFWGYAKPGPGGAKVNARVGCDVSAIPTEQVAPCDPGAGTSIF